MQTIDSAVRPDADGEPASPNRVRGKGSFKPSARSMALVDPRGSADDLRLRSYRLDHALLTCQAAMLELHVQVLEKSAETLNPVGRFLIEQNVIALLNQQQQEQGSGLPLSSGSGLRLSP
jgi:hypothetical protein